MATQQLGVAGMTAETRAFYDKVLLSRTIPNFDSLGTEFAHGDVGQ